MKVIIFFMLGACFNIAFYIWLYIMAFFVADIYMNNQKNFFKNFIYSVKFIFINIKQIILAFLFLAVQRHKKPGLGPGVCKITAVL